MKPVKFKHENTVIAEDQPQYMPLPALKIESPYGEVVSCWKMSFKDRLKVLITGRIWLALVSYNRPLTPSYLSANRREVFSHPDDKKKLWMKIKERSKK